MDKDNPDHKNDPPPNQQIKSNLTESSILEPSYISSTLSQSIHPFSPHPSEIYSTQMSDSSSIQASRDNQASYLADSNMSQMMSQQKEEDEKTTQEWVENLDKTVFKRSYLFDSLKQSNIVRD